MGQLLRHRKAAHSTNTWPEVHTIDVLSFHVRNALKTSLGFIIQRHVDISDVILQNDFRLKLSNKVERQKIRVDVLFVTEFVTMMMSK